MVVTYKFPAAACTALKRGHLSPYFAFAPSALRYFRRYHCYYLTFRSGEVMIVLPCLHIREMQRGFQTNLPVSPGDSHPSEQVTHQDLRRRKGFSREQQK